jgi:alkyl hydroperoxide reductase subunit AhpC
MSDTLEAKPIRLGDVAPDFTSPSSLGSIEFHKWLGDSWCVFFSHPKDFTPVCTTELGDVARKSAEFKKRGVKTIALSVDGLEAHKGWIKDIDDTQKVTVDYPILADEKRAVALLYGMIHPNASDSFTVRTVFIIDPKKKVRLMMTYPAATGRNFDEILRVIDALQLTDKHSVATPANWKEGGDCVIVPSIQDPEEIKRKFPKGHTVVRPYLRMTPQPDR